MLFRSPGEVYELGPHRLVCGDSTDPAVWAKLMGGQKASLCVTSPPYNVGSNSVHGEKNEKYGLYEDDKKTSDYLLLLNNMLRNALHYCEYAFVNLQILSANKIAVIDWLHENKSRYSDLLIWDKGHGEPAMAENVMNAAFECVFIFSSHKEPGRNIKTASFRGTVNNVYAAPGQKDREFASIHSATFPLHLPMMMVETFCSKEAVVCEPFGGTGTTLIACAKTGRVARLIEIDPRYCDVIRRRWTKYALSAGVDPGTGRLD